MDGMPTSRRKISSNSFGNNREPAIARYFRPEQIAQFHAELSQICEQRRSGVQALTARQINEQAAHILAKAADERKAIEAATSPKPGHSKLKFSSV